MAAAAISRRPMNRQSFKRDGEGDMDLGIACEFGSDSDVFRATVLWEKIVLHLERSVKRGFRSHGLRIFGNCFPGYKAVDCLLVYLNSIIPKTVHRSQVLILCDKLLITGVIEGVRSKDNSDFRENNLYRFTGKHFWESETPSSQDEAGLGGLPKSRSDENLAHKHLSRRKPHSRGYTSDSTLGHSTHLRKKKRTTGRTTGKATQRSFHPLSQHSRWSRSSHPRPRTPTQQSPLLNPLEQPSSPVGTVVTSRCSLEQKKPVDPAADGGEALTKHVTILRKERPKLVPVPSSPTGHKDGQEVSGRRESLEKRYSLQMKNAQSAREKEALMQTCRNDVRQRLVVINAECVHRSHSFGSSSSLNTCAESPESARKWIVYGFV